MCAPLAYARLLPAGGDGGLVSHGFEMERKLSGGPGPTGRERAREGRVPARSVTSAVKGRRQRWLPGQEPSCCRHQTVPEKMKISLRMRQGDGAPARRRPTPPHPAPCVLNFTHRYL